MLGKASKYVLGERFDGMGGARWWTNDDPE
jgi:hypothetical protein